MATKKQNIHWTYDNIVIDHIDKTPKNSFAFVYKITLEDGRFYFGKKYIWKPNFTSGAKKGISKGQYSWIPYCSSSIELKELIKKGLKYKKEILFFTFSRAETTYRETKEILNLGLTNPMCLNYWVKATIYSKHLKENS
jgi:Putative endonuclease segE, GIY-YIG domain